MPDFPRAHSQESLTTQQPRALRNDADIRDNAAKRTKMLTDATDTLSEGLQTWQKHVETIKKDTALFSYKLGMQEISNERAIDNDISDQRRMYYDKKMADLRKSVLGSLDSEYLKNSITPELNYMETVGRIGLQTDLRKKTHIHGQAVAEANLDNIAQNPGMTPESLKAQEEAIVNAMDDYVNNPLRQYWNEKEGYDKQKKKINDLKNNWLINQINTNPKVAKEMIQKNVLNHSPKELESDWKVYDRQVREVWNATGIEFAKMKKDGTLTEEKIRNAIDNDMIDPNEGNNLIINLNKRVVPNRTEPEKIDAKAHLTIMRDALNERALKLNTNPYSLQQTTIMSWPKADFQKKAEYRAEVYKANYNGYISDDEMNTVFLDSEISESFYRDPVFLNAQKKLNSLSDQYETKTEKKIARANLRSRMIELMYKGNYTADDALQIASAERIQADFPDASATDLLVTAKKYGKPVWQIYKFRKK